MQVLRYVELFSNAEHRFSNFILSFDEGLCSTLMRELFSCPKITYFQCGNF